MPPLGGEAVFAKPNEIFGLRGTAGRIDTE